MFRDSTSNSIELKQSLREACSRVDIVASLHRHLYAEGGHTNVDLGSYIREFSIETLGAFAAPGAIELKFEDLAQVSLQMDQAVPLALIIGELLTNAIKYAFDGQTQNEISIVVATDDKDVSISVSDNGRGLPADFDPNASNGFGMMIVNALLRQISGRLEQQSKNRGTGFVIRFPQ